MMTMIPYRFNDHDIYYLESIARSVGEDCAGKTGEPVTSEHLDHLRSILPRLAQISAEEEGPSLRGEVLADNHDCLDCFIEKLGRM
jgi:hypothetical protein